MSISSNRGGSQTFEKICIKAGVVSEGVSSQDVLFCHHDRLSAELTNWLRHIMSKNVFFSPLTFELVVLSVDFSLFFLCRQWHFVHKST